MDFASFLPARKCPVLRRGFVVAVLAALVVGCGGAGDVYRTLGLNQSIDSDPVLRWNAVSLDAVLIDHTPPLAHLPGSNVPGAGAYAHAGPCRAARALALTHCAMYDAVMNIVGTHETMFVAMPSAASASLPAATATAAYGVLSTLYPAQIDRLIDALQYDLDALPESPAKTQGITLGSQVAFAVLASRHTDGSGGEYPANSPYVPSDAPGRHRVDPLNPGQGFLTPTWGLVDPVGILGVVFHSAAPTPALTSIAYAAAFDDVKTLGGDGILTPTVRTAEQTEIGIFWAYDGVPGCGPPPRLYNQVVRTIAAQEGNSIAENARLFALVNSALCDAGIAAWSTKYIEHFWRPVVGIRESDPGTGPSGLGDGNAATIGDVNWTPLGAPSTNVDTPNFSPPFPAYTSGHATFGAACFRMLERFYGTDNIAFTIGSDEYNGINRENASSPTPRPVVTRSFTSFSQASAENGRSRIYLGVHWEFDNQQGLAQGHAIADEVYATLAQPN